MKIRTRLGYALTAALFTAMSQAVLAGVGEWQAYAQTGQVQYEYGDYQGAAVSFAAALREAEAFGEMDERLPLTLNMVGSRYLGRGDYTAAEPLLKRALALRKKILGPDHPDVARSSNNLAMLYVAQGKYEKAEPLLTDSIAIWAKVLGQEHPDVATGMNNLAMLYGAQRKYAQAESHFKRAMAIWAKTGDTKNLATATKNLSDLYAETGRPKEAEAISRNRSKTLSTNDKSEQRFNVAPTITVVLPRSAPR